MAIERLGKDLERQKEINKQLRKLENGKNGGGRGRGLEKDLKKHIKTSKNLKVQNSLLERKLTTLTKANRDLENEL